MKLTVKHPDYPDMYVRGIHFVSETIYASIDWTPIVFTETEIPLKDSVILDEQGCTVFDFRQYDIENLIN